MNRIHAVSILCAMLAAVVMSQSAQADPTAIFHNQNTLFEEILVDDLIASETSDRATRTFEITNLTGVLWTDYHFRVTSQTEPPVIFNETLGPGLNNSFSEVMFNNDMTEVWFLDGTVAPNAIFQVELVLWDDGEPNNLGPADVFGTPSIPEPTSIVLMIVGLFGLLAHGHRRRRA